MSKKSEPRVVHVEFATPTLFRWFVSQVRDCVSQTSDGFVVHDEARWSAALSAAEGREISWSVRVRQTTLTVRDGIVVGAMGSDPERFMGLDVEVARKLAARRLPRLSA